MAISIVGLPDKFSPVFNNMYYFLDSTNKTEEGFKYVADVYRTGTSDLLTSLKLWPRPVDGYGVCDINKILKGQISEDIEPITLPRSSNNVWVGYDMEFGEEYINYWEYNDVEFTFAPSPFESFASLRALMSSTSQIYTAGDSIFVEQDAGFSNSSYSGVHTVLSANASTIIIDVPFGTGTTGTEGGRVSFSNKRKTIFTNLANISGYTAFNGVVSHQDFPSYTNNDYNFINNSNAKFLTNAPDGYNVKPTNSIRLDFFSQFLSGITNTSFIVKTELGEYTITGSTYDGIVGVYGCGPADITTNEDLYVNDVGTFPIIKNFCFTVTAMTESGGRVLLEGIGESPWYNDFADEFITVYGEQGEVFSSFIQDTPNPNTVLLSTSFASISSTMGTAIQRTNSYTVQFFSGNTPSSTAMTFNIDWRPNFQLGEDNGIELLFMDRLGSYLPTNWTLQNSRTMNVARDSYKKILGDLNTNTGKWGYNSTDRGITNINTRIITQLELLSDWVRPEDANYIKELYSSPFVYIKENGEYWPVNVLTDAYQIPTKYNKKLIQLAITITYANNDVINNVQ